MKTQISEYEQQAIDFAEKHNLTMTAVYMGHYARFSDSITAQYKITLSRPNKAPFLFDFSTSINDSWKHYQTVFNPLQGLPNKINTSAFFKWYLQNPNKNEYGGYVITQNKKAPSLYDVLACLTKYEPGTFENFCADYGYDNDSIKARDTWEEVVREYSEVEHMFSDCMDELAEIN